jgi:hypothetical protein
LAAILLGAIGIVSIAVALTWSPGSDPGPAATNTTGSVSDSSTSSSTETETKTNAEAGKAATEAPGGVGSAPKKTGLPSKPAGGKVRTGTEAEGCFSDIRAYLDEWHRTGLEPDPCFTTQPPSEQRQPEDVKRTYNGERF